MPGPGASPIGRTGGDCRIGATKLLTSARHRLPAPVIRHAVWLYLRFTLSCRDVEDLLAEHGIDVSYGA